MAFTKAGLWGPDAVLDSAGHPQPGATAAVYLSDGVTLAGLWTTSAKSVALANPTQADIHGNLHFYADPGPYVLKVTVGGTVTTLTVEVPIDPGEAAQDQDVAAALAAAEAYADGVVATAQAASQPLDSDLTAIAALSTTAFGRSFLALADAAAGQSLLGLGTAATQPSTAFDAAGAAAAAQAASQPLDSDLTAIAALSTTAFGRSVLTRVDAAALRTLAGTVIGTDVQAHDPDLDTIAALDSSTAGALSTDGAGWIRKTYAQLKTALGLVKADVGLGNADNTSDANKPVSTAQQAALDLKVATSGPTADLPFNSHKATGLTDPTSAQDAATKAYVDAVAQGLSVKAAVRAASNTNHTLSAPGATVDGVTMVSGDRVLLRAQAAPAENGIWVWNGAAVAMTRATDADTSPEVVSGLYTFVTEGSTWASTGFALITPNPIVLDTTPLTFTPASGAGQIVAGTALTKTGNSLAVSDTELLALAGLTSVADSLPYFTGSGTAALTTLSAFIRSLLDDADAGTARTTLGLDTAATHPATDFAPSSGIAESAVTSLVTDLAAKSPILIPTAVKTGNYTAAIGDYVLCDTSGGIFTVTLPTAPADKTSIAVDLVASGNTLTIARGGADVFQKAGGPTALTMNTADRVLVLQYQSSIAVWHVQDHLPAVITTKGDLLTYGTERARLAVGADGALLGADSTQTTGLKWIPSGTYASIRGGVKWAFPFLDKVKQDQADLSILVVSDSTAVINTPWTQQLCPLLAALWPEKTVQRRSWTDGSGWGSYTTVATGSGTRTVSLHNMSVAGKTTSYCQGGNWQTGVADINPDLIIVSHGHNQNGDATLVMRARFIGLVEQLKLACPSATIALTAQNPQTDNSNQAVMAGEVALVADLCGAGFINIHDLFLAHSGWQTDYMESPTAGIHPNAAGNAVWAAEVATHLTWTDIYQQPVPRPPSSFGMVAPNAGITNPDFSTFSGSAVPSGWTAFGTVAFSSDTTAGHFESTANGYGVKLTATAASSGMSQDVDIKRYAGKWVTFAARVYVPSGQSQSVCRLSVDDSLGGSTVSNADGLGTNGMRWIAVTAYIPSTSTRCRLKLFATDGTISAGNFTVDRVSVSEGSMPKDCAGYKGPAGATGATGPTGGTSRQDLVRSSRGVLAETIDLSSMGQQSGQHSTVPSGELTGGLVGLLAGDIVKGVAFKYTPTTITLSLFKVGLYQTDGTLLASSGDVSGTIGASGLKSIAFSSPYTVLADGTYVIAVVGVYSAGSFDLDRGNVQSPLDVAIGTGLTPYLKQTGRTDLPSPATFVSGTNAHAAFYLAAYK